MVLFGYTHDTPLPLTAFPPRLHSLRVFLLVSFSSILFFLSWLAFPDISASDQATFAKNSE